MIDEELLRSLLKDQHPDLAELPLVKVPGGWDNQLWRLGDEFAVRVPRTPRADDLLRKEWQWLPRVARGLSLPVPVPLRAGEPSERFPRPWTVVRWVAGEPADRAPIRDSGRSAELLADFLRALHQAAPDDAPRSTALSELTETFDERLDAVEVDAPAVRAIWEDAVAAPQWDGPAVWVHADLHPANVVTIDGGLAGVIDFGELCAGDPAIDLAAAWMLLPPAAVPRFFESYADADAAMVRRSRGWAALIALMLVAVGMAGDRGLRGGQPTWGPAGRKTLAQLLR